MSKFKEDIIKHYVSQIEEDDDKLEKTNNRKPSYKYFQKGIACLNIEGIGEGKGNELLDKFLNAWGVKRNVGGNKYWQRELTKVIRTKADKFEKFRQEKLENAPIEKYKDEIKECYKLFKNIIRQVAAAKVLHLICPEFFPPWDTAIAKAYRQRVHKDRDIKPFNSNDYFRFMKWVQEFIKNNSIVLSDLEKKYKNSKVRLVDECLLYAVRNPFYPIL